MYSTVDWEAYNQNADIFILLSQKEGMPNVVLEAMACSLPIIMTPCQGAEELIADNGFVADAAAFKEHIVELVNDDAKRIMMGQNSLKRIYENFGWKMTAEAYLDIISSILGR